MKRPHQISKLIFELDVPGIDDAYRYQNDASSFVRNEIYKVLEELLDKYDQPGKVIRIDKLELDISDLEFSTMGLPVLTDAFRNRLDEQLAEQFHAEKNKSQPGKNNLIIYDVSDDILELILYFFQNGYLPWWASHYQDVRIKDQLKTLQTERPEHFINGLSTHFSSSRFRKRLVNYLEVHDLQRLIPEMTFVSSNYKVTIKKLLEFVNSKDLMLEVLNNLPYQNASAEKKWIELTSLVLDKVFVHSKNAAQELLIHTISDSDAGRLTIQSIVAMQVLNAKEKIDLLSDFSGKHELLSSEKNLHNLILKSKPDLTAENEDLISSEYALETIVEPDNSIYAKHAGLIIIQPYLLPFFDALNLLKNKFFISEKEQHQAVYILHLIASSEDIAPEEHELVFHKILCGLEPEEILNPPLIFTETEKAESKKLLESVVENWSALKRTSAQGLQEMFLKRNGNLRREPNGWNLYIEREAHDILLDKLPWGISMLKAPWNEQLIYVEW